MSQIWLPDSPDDPRSTEEQFLDLLLADDDLLRAEFDAITQKVEAGTLDWSLFYNDWRELIAP